LVRNGELMGQLERNSLGQRIADLLRIRIIRGEIPVGTHLAETQLAGEFEVSRAPVREALLQLQAEGLVSTARNKAFVIGFSDEAIEELYTLRLTLELMAIDRVMDASEEAKWSEAERHIEDMQSAAEAEDPRAFAVADLAFHRHFYEVARHSRLLSVWSLYEKSFEAIFDVTNDRDLRPDVGVHRDLLAAARSGDRELTHRRVTDHMRASQAVLTRALREEINANKSARKSAEIL
jgi:GntR family transcriptional regulator of gluconate operon